MNLTFNLNGVAVDVELAGDELLQSVLIQLEVSSSRLVCGVGVCGACTVDVDGRTVAACVLPAPLVEGAEVTTVEALSEQDPVVRAFDEWRAFQCGFCTPGFVMEARALLKKNPGPSPDEVREHLAGNLCRCGCYRRIELATLAAGGSVSSMDEEGHSHD